MAEQAKKGGKPAAAPDKDKVSDGKVSDGELEKVSGGTTGTPASEQTGDWVGHLDDGPVRSV